MVSNQLLQAPNERLGHLVIHDDVALTGEDFDIPLRPEFHVVPIDAGDLTWSRNS